MSSSHHREAKGFELSPQQESQTVWPHVLRRNTHGGEDVSGKKDLPKISQLLCNCRRAGGHL